MGNCDSCFSGARTAAAAAAAGSTGPTSRVDEAACLALIQKAKSGDVAGVQELLSRDDVDVNFANTNFFNYTALHLAAGQGKQDVVRVLLDQKGILVDPRSQSDETPLIMAARSKHLETVDLLMVAGANLEAKTNYGGNMAKSAREYVEMAVGA